MIVSVKLRKKICLLNSLLHFFKNTIAKSVPMMPLRAKNFGQQSEKDANFRFSRA